MSQLNQYGIVELTTDQVVGFNLKAISDSHRKNPASKEYHALARPSDLKSLIGSIFYRDFNGHYLNLPIERLSGLILYRISEGQCFVNGNKRTALLSCYFFLFNNGYILHIDRNVVNDLQWGFARDPNNPTLPAKYQLDDAIAYVADNIMVRP